jgi:Uma2 family endonuclease
MPMVLPAAYTTADAVRAMPDDGNRYEVVWGELLVSPSPRPAHQRMVVRLTVALSTYCERLGDLETMVSPADISWSDDTLVQPDVFVVPRAEAADGAWAAVRTLLLVVEILSPSTARHDRFTKRRLYQEQGIPTIWLVDLEAACVEVWTPAAVRPVIVHGTLTWHAPGAAQPLQLDVGELLRSD